MPRTVSTHAPQDAVPDGPALLILDMIAVWDFPDAEHLLPGAQAIAPALARLAGRFRRAGLPVIYANDNRGRWRSDFHALVALALAEGGAGAAIARQLAPEADDYFVLKPKHSAFYATPLELLLADLRIGRLVVTGVAADQCVLASVHDARMRDREVVVPQDCIATQGETRQRAAIRHLEHVLKVPTTRSSRLRLTRPSRAGAAR